MIRRLSTDVVNEVTDRRLVNGGRGPSAPVAPLEPDDMADAETFRSGYADGFEAGEQDGRRVAEEYRKTLEDDARRQLDAGLGELEHERERLAAFIGGLGDAVSRHDEDMRFLAFEIALASLGRAFGELPGDRPLLQRLCAGLIGEYRAKAERIHVSTADRAALPARIDGVDILVDGALADGECRLETAHGQVESSIAMRLRAIYDSMLGTLGVENP
jgi:hypothetical protein